MMLQGYRGGSIGPDTFFDGGGVSLPAVRDILDFSSFQSLAQSPSAFCIGDI